MQCVECHHHITNIRDGFVLCPKCHTVNVPKPSSAGTSKASASNALRSAFRKPWMLGSTFAIFIAVIITGLYLQTNSPESKQQNPAVAQVRAWDAEDTKIKEAQKLISENKLDEAVILLSQIDKNYPRYSEVEELLRAADSKKTEIARQNVTQPSPPVASPPKRQSSSPATRSSAFSTSIQIRGDSACQSSTMDALKLLNDKAPAHYATVTKYVGVIECAPQGSGMFAYENPTRYLVGDATRNAGTVWYAGTIAHDAGHSQLYHTYLSAHPGASVPNNIWTGESAEKTCLEAQYDALAQIGGTQAQLDYIKTVINSQYYNVPYEQRWW